MIPARLIPMLARKALGAGGAGSVAANIATPLRVINVNVYSPGAQRNNAYSPGAKKVSVV